VRVGVCKLDSFFSTAQSIKKALAYQRVERETFFLPAASIRVIEEYKFVPSGFPRQDRCANTNTRSIMKKSIFCLLILAAALTAGCAGKGKNQAPPMAEQKPLVPIGALDNPGSMFGRPLACKTIDVQAFSYVAKRPRHKKKAVHLPPPTGAWGDLLEENLKCIAVSPDLLGHGLTRNTKVRIHGLSGEYLVLDTMSKRWTKSIDIYNGTDLNAALQWGSREVRITFDQTSEEKP
jgi:3D (Asp-Asp-Asp) domain-containing protein